jgi:hypothetical protein
MLQTQCLLAQARGAPRKARVEQAWYEESSQRLRFAPCRARCSLGKPGMDGREWLTARNTAPRAEVLSSRIRTLRGS